MSDVSVRSIHHEILWVFLRTSSTSAEIRTFVVGFLFPFSMDLAKDRISLREWSIIGS